MKITDLETYLVETRGLIKWVFVKLSTDEGIVGYGEAGNAFRERAQAAAVQELKPLVVGRDPFESRAFWSRAYKTHLDVRGPSSLHVSALAAIEFAMWDIVGKALKAPLYSLLGGKCRDSVRAYLHAQVWGGEVEPGPEVYVELARRRVAEGFSAIKFDPFFIEEPTGSEDLDALRMEWPKHYYPVVPADLRDRLVKQPLTVEKGHVRVPTTPGLGVELDESALARYRIG